MLRKRYSELETYRNPYLTRARDASRYTIPSLVPREGNSGSSTLKVTYSSFGARAVNSLASKLLLSLFPPNSPFFKMALDEKALEQLQGVAASDIDAAMQKMEAKVTEKIETTATRSPAMNAVRHLIVAGNVLCFLQPDNSLRTFPLSQYVVKRDPSGHPLEIVVEEKVSQMEVPESVRKGVIQSKGSTGKNSAEDTYRLYTGIKRTKSGWEVTQEIEDVPVPDNSGTYPLDACPWMPLRWGIVDGEDYGRSMVEEYLGDLISLEGLTRAMVKGSAVAAKIVFLRKPNGTVKARAFARAETGDVIDGMEGDVVVSQIDKRMDFDTVRQMIEQIKTDLSLSFLMHNAIQRNAERVTAEEIRYMANELDSSLGGIYSLLSMEFQLPYLRRMLAQLQKSGALPQINRTHLKPMITTGIEALGRGAELEKIRAYVADVRDLGGPEALDTYINFDDLMKRLATARQIKPEGLVKTPEEVQATLMQKQQQQMVAQLGPNAVNQAGNLAKTAMTQQQDTQ